MLDSVLYIRCDCEMVNDVKNQSARLGITGSEYLRIAVKYYLNAGKAIRLKKLGRLGLCHDDSM